VNLDYFYKLLWRHVLVVEILKCCFPDEARRAGLISRLIGNIMLSDGTGCHGHFQALEPRVVGANPPRRALGLY